MFEVELKTLGKNHRSTLYTQRSLALTLANVGQFDQAIHHAKENIQLLNSNFPNLTYDINNAHSVLGRVYSMAGMHQLAIEQNLIHVNNWTEGNENNYARSLQLIAQSYQSNNQFDQATEYFQKWTTHLAEIYGETDAKHLAGLLEWAAQSIQMGRESQAKKLTAQVQSILQENNIKLDEIQAKINQLKL